MYCIVDRVTDEYILSNGSWDGMNGYDDVNYSKPMLFSSIKKARDKIRKLTKDFLKHDSTSKIDFIIYKVKTVKGYKFYDYV